MIQYQITGRQIQVSESMWNAIHDEVQALEHYFDRITSCDVTVSSPHRRHQKGNVFHVHVKLSVPGEMIVIDRESEQDDAHEDFYIALRDAFRAATRKLQDYVAKMRGPQRDSMGA